MQGVRRRRRRRVPRVQGHGYPRRGWLPLEEPRGHGQRRGHQLDRARSNQRMAALRSNRQVPGGQNERQAPRVRAPRRHVRPRDHRVGGREGAQGPEPVERGVEAARGPGLDRGPGPAGRSGGQA